MHSHSLSTWARRGRCVQGHVGTKQRGHSQQTVHRHITKCLSHPSHPVTVSTACFVLYDIAPPLPHHGLYRPLTQLYEMGRFGFFTPTPPATSVCPCTWLHSPSTLLIPRCLAFSQVCAHECQGLAPQTWSGVVYSVSTKSPVPEFI